MNKRWMSLLMMLVVSVATVASGQMLSDPVNGSVEGSWVDDPDFMLYDGDGTIETNRAWEWFGGASWLLQGWNADGTHAATDYYVNGQYGPNKDPRDFTAYSFNGTVPAFTKNQWTVHPVMADRVAKQVTDTSDPDPVNWTTTSTSENAIQFNGWVLENNHYVADAAEAGRRVRVNFSYVNQPLNGSDLPRFRFTVFGLNDYNENRQPYFSWDVDSEGDAMGSIVQPGPDYIVWNGDSTGQAVNILDENDDPTLTQIDMAPTAEHPSDALTWDWQDGGFSFVVPEAEPGRGGSFDNLAVVLTVYGRSDLVRAIDELSMIALAGGDANEDGKVDVSDLGILAGNWSTSGKIWTTGDFTGDGVVDVSDLGVMSGNWGTDYTAPATVPEPATLSLLALGGLALIRRRK